MDSFNNTLTSCVKGLRRNKKIVENMYMLGYVRTGNLVPARKFNSAFRKNATWSLDLDSPGPKFQKRKGMAGGSLQKSDVWRAPTSWPDCLAAMSVISAATGSSEATK
eukprot:GEMP01101087.1.p1 GENE.GEMP01101087.1~~GEMP01101087.1.p1  ORF type:complete len:108 (+),score=15.44 GEMP01101087.1:111-434(+)